MFTYTPRLSRSGTFAPVTRSCVRSAESRRICAARRLTIAMIWIPRRNTDSLQPCTITKLTGSNFSPAATLRCCGVTCKLWGINSLLVDAIRGDCGAILQSAVFEEVCLLLFTPHLQMDLLIIVYFTYIINYIMKFMYYKTVELNKSENCSSMCSSHCSFKNQKRV